MLSQIEQWKKSGHRRKKKWIYIFKAKERKQYQNNGTENLFVVICREKHLSATERSPWINMITRQRTPFFSSSIWTLDLGTFHFCILRLSKFTSMRSSLCFMIWSVKQFYMPKMTISSLLGAKTRNLGYG